MQPQLDQSNGEMTQDNATSVLLGPYLHALRYYIPKKDIFVAALTELHRRAIKYREGRISGPSATVALAKGEELTSR
jgi:hypothetical protein